MQNNKIDHLDSDTQKRADLVCAKGQYRPSTYSQWSNSNFDQGERLANFEKWVIEQLATKLRWPTNPKQLEKQIFQSRALIMTAVADMGNHGFLFQPKELASMITATLDDIATRQRRGEIDNLYPYLKATWDRYVRTQAEELKAKAMQTRSHISQMQGKIDSLCIIARDDQKERKATIREQKLAAAKRLQSKKKRSAQGVQQIGDLFGDY